MHWALLTYFSNCCQLRTDLKSSYTTKHPAVKLGKELAAEKEKGDESWSYT